jgi:hypothetical protein
MSIVFAITVICLAFKLWYGHSTPGLAGTRLLTGTCIVLSLFGAVFAAHVATPCSGKDAVFLWTRRTIFAVALAMLGVWYLALYPGVIIGTDTSIMLSSVIGKDGYSPFSAFWNSFFGGLYALTGSLEIIPVFNMLLCAWTIANLLALTASMGIDRYLIALVVFLLFFFPILPGSTLLWSHDTTAALLRLALVSYVIWLCRALGADGTRATWAPACIVSILIAACALIRSENLLLVVLVPIVLLYYRVFSGPTVAACIVASVLAIALFSGGVERRLYANESKINYSLSLLANPARYFYNNDFVSDTRSADLALLEEVFERDWLRGVRFPYQPYHTKGMVFKAIDDATMRSLKKTLVSIARQNPALVLQNRGIIAWTLFSGSPGADYHSLNASFGMDEHVKSMYLNPNQAAIYDELTRDAERRPKGLYSVAQRIQTYFDPRRASRPMLAVLVWTLIPALVWMCIALAGVRRRRLAALAPLLLLPCVAAVVVTAPAAHFKYVADLYVMGWFLPLLLFAERFPQQRTEAGSIP